MAKKRPHPPFRIPFFRIFYSTTYTTLFIITLILLAITPAALIYTALDANAYQYVCEVGGVYVLVVVLVLFIYSSRLYTNRIVLAAVGKSWIPIEEGEVSKNVRKMIVGALDRSARIALESRPRNLYDHLTRQESPLGDSDEHVESTTVGSIVKVDPLNPPWGYIAHPGWSSPSQLDTNVPPHIYFRTVVHELPNLIEARAVSLAPPSPSLRPSDDIVLADPQVVDLLRRQPTVDLRTYLGHLSNLGLISPPETGDEFLSQYEYARFSPVPATEPEFQDLMAAFANLLAGMQQLPPRVIDMARSRPFTPTNQDNDSSSLSSSTSTRSSSIARSIAGSVFRPRATSSRMPSFYTPSASFYSARTPSPSAHRAASHSMPRPHTSQTENTIHRNPSQQTFGSVGSVLRNVPRAPSDYLSSSGSSTASDLRSPSLHSQRSVIRLAPSPAPGRLPYEWVGDGG